MAVWRTALRSAKQAAELAPNGVPYLLLLARAQRAAEDDADARAALEAILADDPEHPVATQLLAELETTEAVTDAGVVADAAVTAACAISGRGSGSDRGSVSGGAND